MLDLYIISLFSLITNGRASGKVVSNNIFISRQVTNLKVIFSHEVQASSHPAFHICNFKRCTKRLVITIDHKSFWQKMMARFLEEKDYGGCFLLECAVLCSSFEKLCLHTALGEVARCPVSASTTPRLLHRKHQQSLRRASSYHEDLVQRCTNGLLSSSNDSFAFLFQTYGASAALNSCKVTAVRAKHFTKQR